MTTAERVARFVSHLPISSGVHAGSTFALRPWQRGILERIYQPGVRDAVITMPRKNGKTGLASTLVMASLVGPLVLQRGQIVSCAADRAQAALIFAECKAMVERTPALAQRLQVYDTTKRIVHPASGSFYAALSSDAHRLHGLSPTVVIFDELAQTRTRRLYDALVTASGAHANALRIVISTKSADPNHVMSELCHYGEQVNAGILDDPSFVYIDYSAPMEADIFDETIWYACNPALGDFRSIEEMRNFSERARHIPSLQAVFRQYYLNQAIDSETQGFISALDWDACGDEAECSGPAYGGLDLSSSRDMTALVMLWPETGAVKCWFWLPGEGLAERAELDHAPYELWRDRGSLQVTNGRTIDKRAIVRTLGDIMQKHQVERLGYDRWRIEELKALLDDEGITVPLEPVGQGYKDMSPAVDAAEVLILGRDLHHGKHPVLRWHVANALMSIDPAGNRKLDKRRSRGRIDGAVSLAMAALMAERYRPAPELTPSLTWL